MKHMRVKVSFETNFDYDFETQDDIDYWDDQETIDRIIETLSDRTNNYWNDADFEIFEVDDHGNKIEGSPNNWGGK